MPRADTGIVSFTVPRGATISVRGEHPAFANEVTFVVPNQATYDLALIANLSMATPPVTGGFTIINGAQNFRAGSFNISGSGVTVTESPANQANFTFTAGAGAWGGITGTLSSQSDLQAALNAKQASDATLTSLAAFNTNGLLVQTAADTFAGRTITGTANQVNVSNGNGVSGNPTLSLPQSIHTGAEPTFNKGTFSSTIGVGTFADVNVLINMHVSALF